MNVVHQDVSLGDAIFADGYNLGMCAIHAYALLAILAENHRLPVFEVKNFIGPYATLGKNRSWAVLGLRQTINAVIEKNVIDVQVAPQHMHEVIAADRKRIAIAGDYPDTQFGIGGLYSRGDRRRAPMNAVETVRVHVIGKARRATDAGHKNH